MKASANTKKIHRNETIARAVIWTFTGLTVVLLGWILGFILYRGFVSNNNVAYDFADISQESLTLDDGSQVVFIAHKKIKADDLQARDLQELYTGVIRELNKWSEYTHQNVLCQPIALYGSSPFNLSVKKFLLKEKELDEWKSYTTLALSSEEMIDKVSNTPGGLGYIPVGDINLINGKVQILSLRSVQVVMNSKALELNEHNSRFQEFTEEGLLGVFSGQVDNMNQIGGNDVKPLAALAPNVEKEQVLSWFTEGFNAVEFSSMEEFYAYLSSHPEVVGLVNYTGYDESLDYSVVSVVRKELGQNLDLAFLIEKPTEGDAGGISYFIINTLLLILATLFFSAPIGILAAVYLVEYAKQGPLVQILRMGTETLAGIPSIVFGLFGRIFFVNILGMGIGFISSTLTVTLMILPTLVRTSEEAIKSVSPILREGSMGMGATKWQTIFRVVLPSARQGILTGVILAVGRVAGETAVLLYTLGSSYDLVRNLKSPARVLSLHLYLLFTEAISFDRAFATGAVLVIIIMITNLLTRGLIKKN